jgi:hypothetical protein
LPTLRESSPLYYLSKGNFYDEKRLQDVAKIIAESNTSVNELKAEFEKNLVQYHAKTYELMEKAGVHKRLESMESRIEANDMERILANVRGNIRNPGLNK